MGLKSSEGNSLDPHFKKFWGKFFDTLRIMEFKIEMHFLFEMK